MINYFQIQRLASLRKVPEEIIEKDYFIELLLLYLSKDEFFNKKAVFRGGTALRKIYFSDYRYSEDLDFLIDEKEKVIDYEKSIDKILLKIHSDFPFKPLKLFRI
jgi:predicted nucleotidyltransferase component of viral defense system